MRVFLLLLSAIYLPVPPSSKQHNNNNNNSEKVLYFSLSPSFRFVQVGSRHSRNANKRIARAFVISTLIAGKFSSYSYHVNRGEYQANPTSWVKIHILMSEILSVVVHVRTTSSSSSSFSTPYNTICNTYVPTSTTHLH